MDEPHDAGKQVTPPVDIGKYDLTIPAPRSDNPPITRNGKPGGIDSPAQQMRDLGFDPCTGSMTPLEFLVAVMNEDCDKLYRQKKKRNMMKSKGIGLNYRIECAKTAAKFMHMAMPSVQITSGNDTKFGDDLAAAVAAGNARVERKTVIIETVEQISPDMPIAAASYPPAFADIQGTIVEETLDAEGDTDYDPDKDD